MKKFLFGREICKKSISRIVAVFLLVNKQGFYYYKKEWHVVETVRYRSTTPFF